MNGWLVSLPTMLEFGLTGGIGSGKSTVAMKFAGRGALIIDADAIVRELQQPEEQVFDMMVARWGSQIVTAKGTLDRGRVADIVFSDDAELDALNEMVHPAVAAETERRIASAANEGLAGEQTVVIHDIPLLVLPGGELLTSRELGDWRGIIVVDVDPEIAVERVVASRGLDADDVRARQRAQATREERVAAADFVIDNSGTIEDLEEEVERCWRWMVDVADGVGSDPTGDKTP